VSPFASMRAAAGAFKALFGAIGYSTSLADMLVHWEVNLCNVLLALVSIYSIWSGLSLVREALPQPAANQADQTAEEQRPCADCDSEPALPEDKPQSPFGNLHGPNEGPDVGLGHRNPSAGYPGLEEFASSRGAKWYMEWLQNRLAPPARFTEQFPEAMLRTRWIHFALDGLGEYDPSLRYPDLSGALSEGATGWGVNNMTNTELYLIVNNPAWYAKATFYYQMKPVKVPFGGQGGQ
jgi:hypothetical protein